MESETQLIIPIYVVEKQRDTRLVRTSFAPCCYGKHLERETAPLQPLFLRALSMRIRRIPSAAIPGLRLIHIHQPHIGLVDQGSRLQTSTNTLFEETLVIWMGEFGRTPRINAQGGRDHWGQVFSVALAGAGIRGGVVHGASDSIGAYPRDGRVLPHDLAATIFHCLGIPAHAEIQDPLGRPVTICQGEAIRQAIGNT